MKEGAGSAMEEDERQEAANESTTCPRSESKPSGVTQSQLEKFQELQRRRLQIKSKFKKQLKPRNPCETKNSPLAMVTRQKDEQYEKPVTETDGSRGKKESSPHVDVPQPQVLNKRRKLRWGLDAKERWERKANM